ncbi:hypothetical protein V8G54_001432 [Vigna mungo]|uniref:Uncharacterized protein n=1 Tax=Vigna mungo TaxID=3915 RepID=A0AAQ3P7B5_VIGMU
MASGDRKRISRRKNLKVEAVSTDKARIKEEVRCQLSHPFGSEVDSKLVTFDLIGQEREARIFTATERRRVQRGGKRNDNSKTLKKEKGRGEKKETNEMRSSNLILQQKNNQLRVLNFSTLQRSKEKERASERARERDLSELRNQLQVCTEGRSFIDAVHRMKGGASVTTKTGFHRWSSDDQRNVSDDEFDGLDERKVGVVIDEQRGFRGLEMAFRGAFRASFQLGISPFFSWKFTMPPQVYDPHVVAGFPKKSHNFSLMAPEGYAPQSQLGSRNCGKLMDRFFETLVEQLEEYQH